MGIAIRRSSNDQELDMLTRTRSFHREQKEIIGWLNQHEWHFFVTLASNTPRLSPAVMRNRFRRWDAIVNREVLGLRSLDRHERLFTAAFLEKPRNMPHWHLLIRVQQDQAEALAPCPERLKETATNIWKKLTPSGSVDAQVIYDRVRIVEYVAKELKYPLQYENMILPLEFCRH